jgi:NADH-quinone oxidoreductase subunit A
MNEYLPALLFGIAALVYGGGALLTSRLFAAKGPDKGRKREAYESGEVNIGEARVQFKLGYYFFALAFLVFDVEALFLFPVLAVFRPAAAGEIPGVTAWIVWCEVAAFIAVLVLALYYARRKKALEWE